ncbi:unnamed protein product [Brassica oleracea]
MNEKKELPENTREDSLNEETKSLISSLPSHKDFLGKQLYNYQGCWYYPNTLQGVLNFQKGFKPQETDIILASFPKSGTTWLKALTIALFERFNNTSSSNHPLQSDNPHGLVPFLEMSLYHKTSTPDLTKFSSSPRLFSTHMPFHTLQAPFKDDSSRCKIVYVCRNVKDVLVSQWYFRCAYLGKEINKTGKTSNNLNHSSFFRKGEVGDSNNHLTPQMETKIDMIIEEKYKGSGFKY